MKKLVAIFAVVALLAVAAPVFAATNPFMDVPMNHWAYDAVASLAAKGILSGYPDGLYKGKQSMTRYEVASALARALSYVDMTTASKQDVEMLKKLVVEFKDELDALGVRVDALEEGFGKLNSRLGGWQMGGRLRLDLDYRFEDNMIGASDVEADHMGSVGLGDARVNIGRWFGEDESMFFNMQIRTDSGNNDMVAKWGTRSGVEIRQFYASLPVFYDMQLTVGRFGGDDADKRFGYSPGIGRYGVWGWFDDGWGSRIQLTKNFALGNFAFYVDHSSIGDLGGTNPDGSPYAAHAWNFTASFNGKLNEMFGFGIGAQYLAHDDWNNWGAANKAFNSVFTGWLGLDFNFMQGLALHGIVYFQSANTEDAFWGTNGTAPDRADGGSAWRFALDVSQEVLKFTSFYAEYGKMPAGFFALNGVGNNLLMGDDEGAGFDLAGVANYDMSWFRIGANQRWNDKWATWLTYADIKGAQAFVGLGDTGVRELGVGVEYFYNPNTTFSLNYLSWSGKDAWDDRSFGRVRFTTQITF